MEMDLVTLERIFAKIDTLADGTISIKDMYDALSRLEISVTLEETEAMVNMVCRRGTRSLNFEEFCHLMYILDHSVKGDLASIAFLVADTDYSRTVEEDELRCVLKSVGITLNEHEIHRIMEKFGEGGSMTYNEFMRFIHHLK